jgi:hypothetical protein
MKRRHTTSTPIRRLPAQDEARYSVRCFEKATGLETLTGFTSRKEAVIYSQQAKLAHGKAWDVFLITHRSVGMDYRLPLGPNKGGKGTNKDPKPVPKSIYAMRVTGVLKGGLPGLGKRR